MARGRWLKYEKVNSKILAILRNSNHLTTNQIVSKLKNYNIYLSWTTVNLYVEELKVSGHIEVYYVEKKNRISLWKLKKN